MQYCRIFLTLFFSFVLFSAQAEEKPTMVIAADSWCPINCAPPEARLGVGIDLAKAIFEPLGYTVEYKIMPWTEALEKVRKGEVDAVVGAGRIDDPTLIFPQQSVYNVTDDFYVLKNSDWDFEGVRSLKRKKLGVIADYGYSASVTEYIKDNKDDSKAVQFATGAKALKENIKKLLAHQVDVLVETRPVMEYTLNKMHIKDRVKWAGSVPQAPVYLAFSPALPESKTRAAQFDAGMRQFIRNDKLHDFYNAYGLSLVDR